MNLVELKGPGVPPIRGHYSHAAILPGGLLLLSGQKAWSPDNGQLIEGGIAEQTDQIFDNVQAMLAQLAMSLGDVVRVTCHLANIEDYEIFNAVYARRFNTHRPARTVLGGYRLREGALLELVFEAYSARLATLSAGAGAAARQ